MHVYSDKLSKDEERVVPSVSQVRSALAPSKDIDKTSWIPVVARTTH